MLISSAPTRSVSSKGTPADGKCVTEILGEQKSESYVDKRAH